MFNKLKQSQEMNYDYDENMKYFKKNNKNEQISAAL